MDRPNAGTVIAALLAATLCSAPGLAAQSITSGELNGLVVDDSGLPVPRARVVATSATSGWRRVILTPASGAFRFTRMPPGAYEILVEIIGYKPVRVLDVPVRPGQRVRVPVTIAPATPPVLEVDTVSLDIGVARIVTPGGGRWLHEDEINDFADRLRTISALSALSTHFDASLGSDGLPSSMTQTFVDGLPFTPARHPALPGGAVDPLVLPRSGLAYLSFPEDQTDIEWQGGTGGYTTLATRSGGRLNSVDVFGGGSTDRLWNSPGFENAPSTRSFWGGARASIPLVADTTRLFLAVEGYDVETPRLPILSSETASALPGVGDRASELGAPWVDRTRSVSGAAQVDWALSPTAGLQVGAMVAGLEIRDGLAMRSPASYGTTPPLDALDLLVSSALTAKLFSVADLELRAGFQRSVREYVGVDSEAIPGTRLVNTGGWVGLDPSLPASVTRTSFVGGPIFHFQLGRQFNLKVGGDFSIPSFAYESPIRGVGSFTYPSTSAMANGNGAFTQISGPRPAPRFSLPRVGGFLQYAWEAVPGLRMTGGIRYDAEYLPSDDMFVDPEWTRSTGLRADAMESRLDKLSARVGLRWDLTSRGRTMLVMSAGTHQGDMDPAPFSEALSFGGGVDIRRATGELDSWPDLPDATAVPVTGARIALMSPRVKSPRTTRGHIGLWQMLGGSTVLQVSGSVRQTDFLMRRTDLNMMPAPSGRDQYGRAVFGQFVQYGSLLTPEVGSNRRFAEFDQVWGLNPDGWSRQVAATASLDHKISDGLELFGAYTWSRTEDNWLGAASGQPDAALDPGLDDLTSKPWSEGTSDFDVPHRVAAGVWMRRSWITLTGTYRFQSAYPFTAGYRAGVDANGDGSALNDVAFVADEPALLELAGEWNCLESSLGRFAARNGCRGKGVHALDVRVSFDVLPSRGRRMELVLEGFNLLASEVGLRDNALFLVDGSRSVSVDPATGDVDVPVNINPGFGRIVTSTSPGRMVRVGFRFGGGLR